jgi:hypothetical protein
MGSMPQYGYKSADDNRHKLVIDEAAAVVVRRVFELFKNNEPCRRIADILNSENLPNPQAYYYISVGKSNPYTKNAKTWCAETVKVMLQRDVYLGHTTQGKRRVVSYNDKKREVVKNPEKWIKVENTHEALIDPDTFNAVQALFSTNRNSKPRRTSLDNEVSLFANIVRCADCDGRLTFNSTQRKNTIDQIYRCGRYIQHSKGTCTPHRITFQALRAVVLDGIQKYARLAHEDEEKFIQDLYSVSREEQYEEAARAKKQITTIRTRLREVERLTKATFEKHANGKLPDKTAESLYQSYEEERNTLEAEEATLTAALEISERQSSDIAGISKEVAELKQYFNITELTREVVTKLIKEIRVSEPLRNGKEKTYEIDIRYRFQKPFIAQTKENTVPLHDILCADQSC